MRTNPVEHKFGKPILYPVSFTVKYQKTIPTSYGKHIVGHSRGFDYDIYIKGDKEHTEHKLYYVRKAGEWIKSRLLFFENNKLVKEVKSRNVKLDYNTDV